MIKWSNTEKIVTDEDIKHRNDVIASKKYLTETDWYFMRFVETGKVVPKDIQIKRDQARSVIEE